MRTVLLRKDGTGNRAIPFAKQAELAKLADWSDESLAHACAKIRYPHLRQPDPLEVLGSTHRVLGSTHRVLGARGSATLTCASPTPSRCSLAVPRSTA
jgi:hypothetical protein